MDTNQHISEAEGTEVAAGRRAWVKEGADLLFFLLHSLGTNTWYIWDSWLSSFNNCVNSYRTAHEVTSTSALINNYVCWGENSRPHTPAWEFHTSVLFIQSLLAATDLNKTTKHSPSYITVLNVHTRARSVW